MKKVIVVCVVTLLSFSCDLFFPQPHIAVNSIRSSGGGYIVNISYSIPGKLFNDYQSWTIAAGYRLSFSAFADTWGELPNLSIQQVSNFTGDFVIISDTGFLYAATPLRFKFTLEPEDMAVGVSYPVATAEITVD